MLYEYNLYCFSIEHKPYYESINLLCYLLFRVFSTLNSCSIKLSRLNSHDNSNAVRIGSFEDNATKLGLAKAR